MRCLLVRPSPTDITCASSFSRNFSFRTWADQPTGIINTKPNYENKVAGKLELLARQHAQASEDLAVCRREKGEAFRQIEGYRRMKASYEELQEAHLQQGAVLQRYQAE